jgi:eukaryotic-like serine/threonine-protein kinase
MANCSGWIAFRSIPFRDAHVTVLSGTDRFDIRRCLGSGSFGVVYEAFDRERNTRVALKLPHLGSAQGLYLFKQEFRSLADITHRNLATLFELLAAGDRWFFTMELVDGSHFLDHLRTPLKPRDPGTMDTHPTGWTGLEPGSASWDPEGPASVRINMEPQEALMLPSPPPDHGKVRAALKQLSEGLSALHAGGMLHRDLKPSNVLVARDGRVVILDFGLVTGLEGSPREDFLGGVAGTPAYMSPEQLAGQPTTAASDWYSVGVMLYQVLTGRLPFTGPARAMLAQKRRHDPLEPRALVPATPRDLDDLCMGLLRREPGTRFGALEVQECLQDLPDPQAGLSLEGRPRSLSLVGRENELNMLLGGYQQTREGLTVGVLLHGASGMGKSSLVRGFLREVQRLDDRAVLLEGRCYEQESVPFKALDSLVDELSQYLKRLPAQEASTLLPRNIQVLARLFPVLNQVPSIAEHQGGAEIPDAQELRRRAFGALRELLRRMAVDGPVVLIIDDLQWGDLDSAALLGEILRSPDAPTIMLLLCYRNEDMGSSQILKELLPRLTEAVAVLQDVELRALSHGEAASLARARLDPDSAMVQAQAEWIARESGGIPFFIQELAQYLRRPHPGAGEGREQCLDDYIRVRVEALPEDSRAILQILAIAGYPLEWETIQQVVGAETGSIAALTALRTGHLIRVQAGARRRILETYHDRIRVAIVQSMAGDRVMELNRVLANVLEADSSPDVQALARHFEAAGVLGKASDYAVRAAVQAESVLAFDQAVALYQKALSLRAVTDPENASLQRRLGDALANSGRSPEAAEAYLRATVGSTGGEVNWLQRRAAEEYLRSGNIDAGLSTLGRLLAQADARLPSTRAQTLVSVLWHRLRLKIRGLGFTERAAPGISPAQLERVDIHWAVAMGLGPVDVLRGADFQTRQLLLTLDAGEPFRLVRALAHETILVAAGGNRALEKTHRLRRLTLELAERIGHPNPRARALIAAGIVDTIQGHWRASAQLLARAEEILKQHCTGMDYELHIAQHQGLLARMVTGDLPLIRERLPVLLQEAREKGDLIATTNLRTSVSYVLHLAKDDPDAARRDLEAVLGAWPGQGFNLQHYYGFISRVNIDLYAGAFPAAVQALSDVHRTLQRSHLLRLQPILVTTLELQARAALALASRMADPALLRRARQAIRALRAERTPYGGALALKLEAMRAILDGRSGEAQALLQRSELTFEACDMLLHAMAVRYCRGRLLGNRELLDSASTWMQDKGIQNPGRFAAMHVPLPE